MSQVSIVGAGRVGITLGHLFLQHGHEIGDICNRSLASAREAAKLIGAGTPVSSLGQMGPADILVIAISDNALQAIAREILPFNVIDRNTIAFHCSGATPAEVLASLREKGAAIASVHPVKSFTAPIQDAEDFPGTWCGIEGDARAVGRLQDIFTGFGANVFPIGSESKVLYHAALVFMCNYLFPLIEAGLLCYEKAGVPRDLAARIVSPILHATADNALRLGPGKAITGPIARGDDSVVAKQVQALGEADPSLKVLYEVAGGLATRLSLEKGVATQDQIRQIRRLLRYDLHFAEAEAAQ